MPNSAFPMDSNKRPAPMANDSARFLAGLGRLGWLHTNPLENTTNFYAGDGSVSSTIFISIFDDFFSKTKPAYGATLFARIVKSKTDKNAVQLTFPPFNELEFYAVDEAIEILETYTLELKELLKQGNVDETMDNVVRLWAYINVVLNNVRLSNWDEFDEHKFIPSESLVFFLVSLLRKEVNTSLALELLNGDLPVNFKATKEFDLTVDTLKSLEGLPESYIKKIIKAREIKQ